MLRRARDNLIHRPVIERVIGCARAFRETRGNAAIEFALVLPLMLTFLFGSIETMKGLRASRRVDSLAYMMGNIVSQQYTCSATSVTAPCLTDNDLTGSNGVFQAAAAVMSPYPTTALQMTVSQVHITPNSSGVLEAYVNWSITNGTGATARPCNGGGPGNALLPYTGTGNAPYGISGTSGSVATTWQSYLPANYTAAGAATGYWIVVDVFNTYSPGFGASLFSGPTSIKMWNTSNPLLVRDASGTSSLSITVNSTIVTAGLTTCSSNP